MNTSTARPHIVLVGAGHAHAVVLERWANGVRPEADITLVTDREETLYSGMIPGWIAGEYERKELELSASLMAERAGGRLLIGTVVRVDAESRTVHLEDGTTVAYDVASLDVGSTVRHEVTGAPFVSARRADDVVSRLGDLDDAPVMVVGGGAAGIEMAACLHSRLAGSVTLVERGERLLGSHEIAVSERVRRALDERGIALRFGSSVPDGEGDTLGAVLDAGLVVLATGAAGPPLLRASHLPLDEEGFVAVRDDLRVEGHDHLFAGGDCASKTRHPAPKAGLHAIQQGRILADNLAATVRAWPAEPPSLRSYEAQKDFLTLLNLGDGTALGIKWGFVVEGRWVRWLKDVIDRRFVARFQR